MTAYERIEQAIAYLNSHQQQQPDLAELAHHIGLSQFHFQRLFRDWAGVSPKKFLQYMTIQQAKLLLRQKTSLLDTSVNLGMSSTSRLHDLFISIEAMTPGEFKREGYGVTIKYSFWPTCFGRVIIGSTQKGICYLAFYATDSEGLGGLKESFSQAQLTLFRDKKHEEVAKIFGSNSQTVADIKLCLKGTPFQLKVWHALLQLPLGSVATYRDIAQAIGAPRSSRAVGNAIGANPVAYLIPCHRVIRATGIIGAYRWGSVRKQAMLGWERAQNS